nr:hypothetical protein [Tanacetum cinerariifolium]
MSSFNQCECLGCGQPCDGLYCYPCTCIQCGIGLTNGICLNCTYKDGKPLIYCKCEGPLRGGFCWFCASRAETSFANDPNPNSFDDSKNLSDYSPQPQNETFLSELCGNDSHYGYDCPPRFSFIYEQEPCYNQNFTENYYPQPEYSLSMGDEHLSTISETESDEVIKSSVENIVSIPSEYEVTSDNENTLIDSSSKFDYLLELTHIDLIPPGIEEADFDLEEEICLVENLLYDNSSPRPPKELNDKIAYTIVESLSPSPILVEDSDSQMEEIDLFLDTDDLMPPGIENDDYDSEGDIHFLDELLSNDTLPLPENVSSNFVHHDDLSFPRPPLEPPDVEIFLDFKPDMGVLIAKVVEDISEHHDLMPKVLPTLPTLCLNLDILLPFSSENEDKVIAPDLEASRACCFVHHPLKLQYLAYGNSIFEILLI